jgi:hypothetical protein
MVKDLNVSTKTIKLLGDNTQFPKESINLVILAALWFELKASCLQGRHSTT